MIKSIFFIIFAITSLDRNVHTRDNAQQEKEIKGKPFEFNVTDVILQSILFCGTDIVCDKSILRSLKIPDNINTPKKCPNCICYELCLFEAVEFSFHCCPDFFFQYGYPQCEDLSVVSSSKTQLTIVIASCPINANESAIENCTKRRSETDFLITPPVLGKVSNRLYQNKYCSICNKEYDYEELKITYDCPDVEDFNFISSYNELLTTAKSKQCRVFFTQGGTNFHSCQPHYKNMISTCNVTGTWRRYNFNIEQACLSAYEAFYGMFKNIFCAMCNPPKFIDDYLIDDCAYSNLQAELCLNQSTIEASFPLNNVFCFGCNRIYEDHEDHEDYMHFFLNSVEDEYEDVILKNVDEKYLENESFPFETTLEFKFGKTQLKEYFDRVNKTNFKTKKDEIVAESSLNQATHLQNDYIGLQTTRYSCQQSLDRKNAVVFPPTKYTSQSFDSINITNLIYRSFATTKHGACTPGLLPTYTNHLQKPCSCNVGCTSECCDDFALQQRWTCVSESYNGSLYDTNHDFRVVNGCPFSNPLNKLCTESDRSDFFQTYLVDGYGDYKVTYMNVFCFLCGINIETIDDNTDLSSIHPWPLKFRCKNYTNYRNFKQISQLVNHLKHMKCNISFDPPITAMRCSDVCNVDISTCNVTKSWKNFDSDVLHACEKSDVFTFSLIKFDSFVFKNKFCLTCNPMQVDDLETSQNCVEKKNPNLKRACEEFPTVHLCSGFKNVFCEECKSGNITECGKVVLLKRNETSTVIRNNDKSIMWSFPFTFSLSSYSRFNGFIRRQIQSACFSYQIYDPYHHLCRNMTCFPGKYEHNGSCVSLFRYTSSLRYTLSLKINFALFSENNYTHNVLLWNLRDHITSTMEKILSHGVFIEDLIIMSSYSCNALNVRNGDLLLYLKVFENSFSLQRDDVETELIRFTNTSTNWTLGDNFEVFVQISRSDEALTLPYLALKLSRTLNCFIQAIRRSSSYTIFRNILVSPILKCQQLQLEGNEFGVDWTHIRKKYSHSKFSMSVQKFESYFDGGLRVCADDIQKYIQMLEEVLIHENRTLSFLTLTLICVSLFFLLITFITYCAFQSLRTLPGWNNIILVIFLFFAQLCLVVRPFFRSIAMIVASALTHFFWLSTFFWLQVCSFHMFRVFIAKTRTGYTERYTTMSILKYLLYAIGISVFIVSTNITVTMIITNGEYTGYDKMMTLMTSRTAFIVTLIGPLSIVCITNITFYIMTAYKIYSTPNVERTTRYRIQLTVYVKLFTLTGMTWLLQVVDTFIGVSVLSYIIAILNGLQGLFLFVSFVYNNRVFRLYRNAFNKFGSSRRGFSKTLNKSSSRSL